MEPRRITYSEALAGEIRARMGRARITQASLAEATGISAPTVSRKLVGRHPFDTTELELVAAHLGALPSELLAGAESAMAGNGAVAS